MATTSSDRLLEAGGVAIRRLRDGDDDYRLLTSWLSDPVLQEFWDGRDRLQTPEGVRAKYGPRIRGEAPITPCMIERDGTPVGYLQFYRVTDWPEWASLLTPIELEGTWSIDMFIGEPKLWGTGGGTAALHLAVRHVFEAEGAGTIVITPFAWNARAIRSYEKAGFRKVRLLPAVEDHEGAPVDEWLMSISREEWTAQAAPPLAP